MLRPTPYQVVLQLLFGGAMNVDDAKAYINNYEFFERQRSQIETQFSGRWVASINDQLFSADNIEELNRITAGEVNANRAYREHVGEVFICLAE